MKILITGAAGYLGCKVYQPFEGKHQLRLMDIKPFQSKHETFIGSVADLETCRKAVAGMDALFIAHMASRQEGAYETPPVAFDANVKGTANLFFAGVEAGITRYCVVSTTGTLEGYDKASVKRWTREMPPKPVAHAYSLTKAIQEVIAETYGREKNLSVTVLRFPWVVHADTMITKYGEKRETYADGMTDPWDIGNAARLALERGKLGYDLFYVIGTPEDGHNYDVASTKKELGWQPKYDYKWLPTEAEFKKRQAQSAK
jgi:nucleoside-diphosphate-sugar epimerase